MSDRTAIKDTTKIRDGMGIVNGIVVLSLI